MPMAMELAESHRFIWVMVNGLKAK